MGLTAAGASLAHSLLIVPAPHGQSRDHALPPSCMPALFHCLPLSSRTGSLPRTHLMQQPTASPDDDDFSSIYDDLSFIDPDSLDDLGLKELALRKRAEVETRRRAQSAAGAAAAAAAAGAATKA